MLSESYNPLIDCKLRQCHVITIYKNKENDEISLFDLKTKEAYNLELEISGIWKYKNSAGLYINIISLKNNN